MPNKSFLQKIGFLSKEGAEDILHKKYSTYSIEVNLKNNTIHYGGSIVFNDTKKLYKILQSQKTGLFLSV
jgi:phosphatidylinositol kinase/protein kinase (PI-3  family)